MIARIHLHFLSEASDGPRILFRSDEAASFSALIEIFGELSSKCPYEIRFDKLPFIVTHEDLQITARCGPRLSRAKGLRECSPAGSHTFDWSHLPEHWQYLAELLEPVSRSSSPCHQYLSSYPAEDAIVVASYGEYPESLFSTS